MLRNLLVHKGERPAPGTVLPERFTNPFSYVPDKFCREAADCVQQYLLGQTQWHEELRQGKMFGVLVVQTWEGELGYLAAFSGNLQGRNNHGFFVPPVCDLLAPDEFFKVGEREISAINREILLLEQSGELEELQLRIRSVRESMLEEIGELKENYKRGKMKRESLRRDVSGVFVAELNRESQFQKAEIKRAERRLKEALEPLEQQLCRLQEKIAGLKKLRKEKSAALQEEIFGNFTFLNALGEEKSLLEIFREYYNDQDVLPPGGAGECAAPKLLEYAYLHGMRPVCMGEFWWGDSPKGEIRRHGEFYPSCKGKCAPILGFMLQGLDVEKPVHYLASGSDVSLGVVFPDSDVFAGKDVFSGMMDILYEDEWIVAVDKPSGILSVPGRDSSQPCVADLLRLRNGGLGDLFPVHRLDMHTSGVLVLAKNELVCKELQRQFAEREVSKCYLAVLDGIVASGVSGASGVVSLPLVPDYDHRPCQKVDFEHGKEAVTRFEIVRVEFCGGDGSADGSDYGAGSGFDSGSLEAAVPGRTFVKFYPITGRTHQLRVHSAHPMGLNAPIVGDLLYGSPAGRLMLHAFSVSFVHPVTGVKVEISASVPSGF